MKSKIGILLINDYLSPFGGSEISTHAIFELIKKKCNTFLRGGEYESQKRTRSLIFSPKYFFRLKKFIEGKDIDICHINSFGGNLSSSIFFTIPRKTKIIIHIRDFGYLCPKRGITYDHKICPGGLFHPHCMRIIDRGFIINIIYDRLKWIKFLLNRIVIKLYGDVFICNSQQTAKYFIKYSGISPQKIVTLPNFTTISNNYKIQPKYKDSKTFLFVGSLVPRKGVEVLIYAMNHIVNTIAENDIHLNIVGNGPQSTELQFLVKKLQLEDNITFTGGKDQKDLPYLYKQAICTIIPSMCFETFGLVNIESMKYGTPVIGSNIGGISEIIEDGKNGYLFTLGDHVDLANKMMILYNNKKLSMQMGKYGFEKVLTEYNESKYFNSLLKIYEDIIDT